MLSNSFKFYHLRSQFPTIYNCQICLALRLSLPSNFPVPCLTGSPSRSSLGDCVLTLPHTTVRLCFTPSAHLSPTDPHYSSPTVSPTQPSPTVSPYTTVSHTSLACQSNCLTLPPLRNPTVSRPFLSPHRLCLTTASLPTETS